MSQIQLSIQSHSSQPLETRAWLDGLRVGQRLTASVLAQTGPSQVTLRIGTQVLQAQTQVPLAVGSAVEVLVAKASPGVVLRTGLALSPLPTPTAGSAPSSGASSTPASTSLNTASQSVAPKFAGARTGVVNTPAATGASVSSAGGATTTAATPGSAATANPPGTNAAAVPNAAATATAASALTPPASANNTASASATQGAPVNLQGASTGIASSSAPTSSPAGNAGSTSASTALNTPLSTAALTNSVAAQTALTKAASAAGAARLAGLSESAGPLPLALSQSGIALLSVLTQAASLQAAGTLPAGAAPLVRSLLGAVSDAAALTEAGGLRAALQSSGTWLEALLGNALIQGGRPSERDIKSLLARLLVSLKADAERQVASKTLADLEASVKSSLIGITGNQLKSAGSEQAQTWYFTVPFIWQDQLQNLQASIWRDSQAEGGADKNHAESKWQMRLQLESTKVGRLEVEVSLKSEVVSVNINGDSGKAIERMRASQDRLAQALNRSGLELGAFNVQVRTLAPAEHEPRVDTNA